MGKNIVICSDGTGQIDDGIKPSNVARLCSLLDLKDRGQQICCYDPGVGTDPGPEVSALSSQVDRSGKPQNPDGRTWLPRLARVTVGLAVGYGLKKNVQDMYSYLAENFAKGDRVYLFGFSRGAYTVRVLAGLIARCGLLLPEKLNRFSDAFELYEPHFETYTKEPGKLRELKRRIAVFKAECSRADECRVHFLGIWDTVKSYGYVLPKSLPHTRHNPIVDTVRHALSIDEHRSFFAPTTWGGRDLDLVEGCLPPDEQRLSRDVQEIWFAGDHSDVGGGHDDAIGLAMISLQWMANEAAYYRLRVDKDRYRRMFEDMSHDQFRRHDEATKLLWRVTERAPRRDLKNCPLPPTREWTWKSTGSRRIEESRRDGDILIHETAQAFYSDEERGHLWGGLRPVFIQTAEHIRGVRYD